jgi:hypothetical protein
MSRQKRTTLRNKADKLFSELIRRRGACERCTKKTNLQTSHLISRSNLHLRFDERNSLCLCAGCHMFWFHKNPLEAWEWYRAVYKKDYEYLLKEKNVIETNIDYQKIIDKLKRKLCKTANGKS